MTLALDNFRLAAEPLGSDTTLRLCENGHGIATSRGERFQVGFCDLFRSKEDIATSKSVALFAFFNIIPTETEQDGDMANLASSAALTARSVALMLETLMARGGQHGLQNEATIRRYASPDGAMHDALDAVVTDLPDSPALDHLIETCLDSPLRMDQDYFAGLKAAAKAIGDTFEQRPGMPPGNQVEAFPNLGNALCSAAQGSNAADEGRTFIDLGVDLFVARCDETTLAPIHQAASGNAPEKLDGRTDDAASAASFMFDRLADLTRFYSHPPQMEEK